MEEIKDLKVGDIVAGKVIKVSKEEALIDIGYAYEGTIYKDHLTTRKITDCNEIIKVDDVITVKVTKISEGDQTNSLLLSRLDLEKKEAIDRFRSELEVGNNVNARVKKSVNGGLLLDFHGIELFMPESLIDIKNAPKDTLVGTETTVRIIEIRLERGKEKFIANRKQVQLDEQRQLEKAELATFNVGDIVKGKVERIVDFGAFVHIGELTEGLLHISEISYYHIIKVEDALKVGDLVTVKIIKISGRKISLSMKALEEKPWDLFLKTHKVGDKVEATVIKKMQFGMIMEVEKEVRGLLNRFDYSWNPQENLAGTVEVGSKFEVQITAIDTEKQQFTLSKKHLEYNPWSDVKVRVGELVSATVKTVQEKGAIVEVMGVEAYLPISELADERVEKAADKVKVGDILSVEVIQVFPKEWKMTVSLKRATSKSERKEFESHLNENVSSDQSLADLFAKFKK
ncbi:MAG: S1 RNA-binding domain-containing protein [Candidatus Izemoplasmatales bacterium]|nr:S1 RNA-binding domain-containing protein [Candidatus Izemoplasmatales bacterium]MDD3864755.1 S1 RNA-binding domain-containing protein [Candidatus Izemoplasmatales bacterium]